MGPGMVGIESVGSGSNGIRFPNAEVGSVYLQLYLICSPDFGSFLFHLRRALKGILISEHPW